MNISNWYTVRHHVLVHNWTYKQNVAMECQQVQYGGYPMKWLRKIILKIMHCNNVGFLDLSAILSINFSNTYF